MSAELARIIAGEAATLLGQQAVLNVIQNRAARNFDGHGRTWIEQATAPKQFSAYPDALGEPKDYTLAMIAAAEKEALGNIVPAAINYANPKVGETAKVPWVAANLARGLGVDVGGEGNVFWGPNGTSPDYDPSKAFILSASAPLDVAAPADAGGISGSVSAADPEIAAIETAWRALSSLPQASARRAVTYLQQRIASL